MMTDPDATRFMLVSETAEHGYAFVLDPHRSEHGIRLSADEYNVVRAWLIHEMGLEGRWEIGWHGVTIPDREDALMFRLRWC